MSPSPIPTLPRRRPVPTLAISVFGCELVGASGSVFTAMGLARWYPELVKPALTPPNWVFAPVWTTLFAFLGVAAWLVWRAAPDTDPRTLRLAAITFIGQYILNVAWSAAFFGAQSILGGLVVISLLWLGILATIAAFRRIDRRAGWLLLPYLAWVSFAGYLNLAIWTLN